MTVSKNRKQASSETVGKEEQQAGSRRGKTRVSTILDVRASARKPPKRVRSARIAAAEKRRVARVSVLLSRCEVQARRARHRVRSPKLPNQARRINHAALPRGLKGKP